MSCSRTSRPAARPPETIAPPRILPPWAILALLGAVLGAFPGCRDDLPAPTEAQVKIRFLASETGLATGGRVYLDGNLIRPSLVETEIDTLLPAGSHVIAFRKTCVAVQPADTQSIVVAAGVPQRVDFRVALDPEGNALLIESDPSGLPFRINGILSDQTTPASFVCIEPGRYEISIPNGVLQRPGFDLISGDTLRAVHVPDAGRAEASFHFAYAPKEQIRGVLLELYTATFCPNCPKADEAAADLEADPSFQDDALACVQVHLRWMGSDPFYTEQIGQRVTFYGDDQSAPYVFFNGANKILGSGAPDLKEIYRGKIMETYGQPAKAALYWSNVRSEGDQISADLRFVAIESLTDLTHLQLHAFVAKDSLVSQNPYGVPQFDAVVRDFIDPVPLDEHRAAGSFLDVPVQLDLSPDAVWISHSLRLVAFVQEMETREIVQCREAELRVP